MLRAKPKPKPNRRPRTFSHVTSRLAVTAAKRSNVLPSRSTMLPAVCPAAVQSLHRKKTLASLCLLISQYQEYLEYRLFPAPRSGLGMLQRDHKLGLVNNLVNHSLVTLSSHVTLIYRWYCVCYRSFTRTRWAVRTQRSRCSRLASRLRTNTSRRWPTFYCSFARTWPG